MSLGGDRKRPQDQAGSEAGDSAGAGALPWRGRQAAAANHAINNLREYLLRSLKDERGVHVETLMVVIGTIAGYSALHAVWETGIKPGKVQLGQDMHAIRTQNGQIYYIGDAVSALLLPTGAHTHPFYAFAASAVLNAGIPASQLPNLAEIIEYVTRTVGSPDFGTVRAPAPHKPAIQPRQALNAVWPQAYKILSWTGGRGTQGQSVALEQWPAVVGCTTHQLITMSRTTLDPLISLRLIMESALATSKVDPATVPQGVPAQA